MANDYHVKTSDLIHIDYWNQQRPDGILDKNGYKEPLYCREQGFHRSPVEVAGIGLEVPLEDGSKMKIRLRHGLSDEFGRPEWRPFRSTDIDSVSIRLEQDQAALDDAIALFKLKDGTVREAKASCLKTSDGRDIERASCLISIPLETGNVLSAYSNMPFAKPAKNRTDDLIRAMARVELLETESEKAFRGKGWP